MLREFRWSIAMAKQELAVRELIAEGFTSDELKDVITHNYHPCSQQDCGICSGSYCADWAEWRDAHNIQHTGFDRERVNEFYGTYIY